VARSELKARSNQQKMAPLDKKWFTGEDELPELIAENLEVTSLDRPLNSALGRNGWDGKIAAGIG
jgi:hypothetical protein